MDRSLVDASYDLFATPWRTFRQITLPMLLPAIIAGFLLSFTFSFDDYVISAFVSGVGSTTLPLFVFGQMRRGVTPKINAVAAVMLRADPDRPVRDAVAARAPHAGTRRPGHDAGRRRDGQPDAGR